MQIIRPPRKSAGVVSQVKPRARIVVPISPVLKTTDVVSQVKPNAPVVLPPDRIDIAPPLPRLGEPRAKIMVPISPSPDPNDILLFEDPVDSSKKSYLPRYRMREHGGRYEIGIIAGQDGKWHLSVGLERFSAKELNTTVQGAAMLAHEIVVSLFYNTGPDYSTENTVRFNEKVDDAKGVTVSVGLDLAERDALLGALKTIAANPRLVVHREINVAVNVDDQKPPDNMSTCMLPTTNARRIGLKRASPQLLISLRSRSTVELQHLQKTPVNVVAAKREFLTQNTRASEHDLYQPVRLVLDNMAMPDPFVLLPEIHGYFYAGAAAGGVSLAEVTGFNRITLLHPQNHWHHTYLQDKSEPWVFYYLPDRFKLSRENVAPFRPEMLMYIATPDGSIENVCVTVNYVVKPWTDPTRLTEAAAHLKATDAITVGVRRNEPELRPLQAKASLKLRISNAGMVGLIDQDNVVIDLTNGFVHSLTVSLNDFHLLYASAFARNATGLFSGQVLVETGQSIPDMVPVEIRFNDTQGGEILSFDEQVSNIDGTIAVRMRNCIESPIKLKSLPVKLRQNGRDAPANIVDISFDAPIELEPGGEVAFTVKPQQILSLAEGTLNAIFDTTAVEVLPNPETILPLISDTLMPTKYMRQIYVTTDAETLDSMSIRTILVEFNGIDKGILKLSSGQLDGTAEVWLPLMNLLLGQDVQGRYAFRQEIVLRNNTTMKDDNWRESDADFLFLPASE